MEILKGFEQVNVYVDGLGIVKKTIKVEDGKIDKMGLKALKLLHSFFLYI